MTLQPYRRVRRTTVIGHRKGQTMGSAPSIKDMQAKEDDFDAWVKKRSVAVADECSKAREDLMKQFKEEAPDDLVILRDKYYSDFTHDETFSLAAISDIIHKVTGALFGDPGASSTDSTKKEGGVDASPVKPSAASLTAVAAAYGDMAAMITAKALNLVAGLLAVFDTHASLKGSFQGGFEQVMPGLYLGIQARRTEYSGKDWLHDTTILETYFVVVAGYSKKAHASGRAISGDAEVDKQLDALRAAFTSKFEAALPTLDPFSESGVKEVETLKTAIKTFKDLAAALVES